MAGKNKKEAEEDVLAKESDFQEDLSRDNGNVRSEAEVRASEIIDSAQKYSDHLKKIEL